MSETPKKKLCWNCETRVTPTQENCNFCGVYLSPTTEKDHETILIPPYRIQAHDERNEIPGSPYAQNESEQEADEVEEEPVGKVDNLSIKVVLMTIVFLLLGSLFLLFSAVLLIFSQNGMLILRWSSEYWYVYAALAIPMLFLGWKGLNRIPESEGA